MSDFECPASVSAGHDPEFQPTLLAFHNARLLSRRDIAVRIDHYPPNKSDVQ